MKRRGPKLKGDEIAPRILMDSWTLMLRAVTYAAGKAAGATMDEIAEHIGTDGVDKRTVYRDIEKFGSAVEEMQRQIQPFVKVKRSAVKQLAKEEADKELESMLGLAFSAIRTAMEGGASPEAAAENGWKVIHQLRGKPNQPITGKVSGQVDHIHTHEHFLVPRDMLRALDQDLERDRPLIERANHLESRQITGEVIDVSTGPSN